MTSPQDPYAPYPGGANAPAGQQVSGYGTPPPARRNGLGVAALVIGILSVLTSITVIGGAVLGVGAIVLGVLGRGRVARREADNRGVATAGLVLGILGLLLSAALIAFGVSLLNSPEGKQLTDCVDRANGDQNAVAQCQTEFNNR